MLSSITYSEVISSILCFLISALFATALLWYWSVLSLSASHADVSVKSLICLLHRGIYHGSQKGLFLLNCWRRPCSRADLLPSLLPFPCREIQKLHFLQCRLWWSSPHRPFS